MRWPISLGLYYMYMYLFDKDGRVWPCNADDTGDESGDNDGATLDHPKVSIRVDLASEEADQDVDSQRADRGPGPLVGLLPCYLPDFESLHLASRHRIHQTGDGGQRVTGGRSRHQSLHVNGRSVKRRRRTTASSSATNLGASDDEARSILTESDGTAFDYNVKELDDSVFDDGEESGAQPTVKENKFQTLYRRTCKSLGITPATIFIDALRTNEISLRNHVIGPIGAKACAITLFETLNVTKFDLHGNALGPHGASYVCQMMEENISITHLDLSENGLGSEGLTYVTDMMSTNTVLHWLSLSGNGLTEKDAENLATILRENMSLTYLDLSHNELMEAGAIILGNALADNTTLEELDLSWNHIRRKGAIAIAEGLQRNLGLKTLDLGWNGFYLEGCRALSKALEVNNCLETLDITCNRINYECMEHIIRGLRGNSMLKHITLARNPVTTEGATLLLEFIDLSSSSQLVYIDITGQDVDKDFNARLEGVLVKRPDLEFLYRLSLLHNRLDTSSIDNVFMKGDPMLVLMEFMRLKNLRLVDLFHSLDNDRSNSLSKDEFKLGLMKNNVPLTENMLDKLVKKLDSNGNGEVEFKELIEGQKEHKRNIHQLLNDTVQQKLPFEETQIGRVSLKLREIMSIKEQFWTNKIAQLSRNVAKVVHPHSNTNRTENDRVKPNVSGETNNSGGSIFLSKREDANAPVSTTMKAFAETHS